MSRISNQEVSSMYYGAKAQLDQDWKSISEDKWGRPLSVDQIIDNIRNQSKQQRDAHTHAINRRDFAARIAEEREI